MKNLMQHPLERLALSITEGDASLQASFRGAKPGEAASLFDINASGEWYYQGAPLPTRFAKLFAGILHGIEGEYFLMTPVETIQVRVVDVPLLIVEVTAGSTAST
ncbi:MAG: DUF1285 domain-containing protein, partial [Shewanella sp.]